VNKRFLVTGNAGFVGYHVSLALLAKGHNVIGLDNLNDYYDPALKAARLERLQAKHGFSFQRINIADASAVKGAFAEDIDAVVHLAAQAGVRYSLVDPMAYVESNLVGSMNVLEGCRNNRISHLVYASSSSVYGANTKIPFSVEDRVDQPMSLYAATKRSTELMAYSYSHLFGLPITGLRFFTVYGPWGRPDMAYFLFTKAILQGSSIDVFNNGQLRRDFTYIDDIVDGVLRVLQNPPDVQKDGTRHQLYNIGSNEPVPLSRLIAAIESATGRTAKRNLLPMQPGDMIETYADIDRLTLDTGFRPSTTIEAGIQLFVDWYRSFYGDDPATPQ
jgi:UDP-glucuronate 4-epimerase